MYLLPVIIGASAVLIGGYGLYTAYLDGDKPFCDAQAFGRAMRLLVLPIPVMKALFYPLMAGLIAFGVFVIGHGLSAW